MVGKNFSDVPIKYKEEIYEEITEMSKNNDCATENFLDYEYFSKHYQLLTIDFSKQTELENLDLKEEDNEATMLFNIEKLEESTLNFAQNSAIIV